jgi:predicted HTH transcriptional regulator
LGINTFGKRFGKDSEKSSEKILEIIKNNPAITAEELSLSLESHHVR